MTAIEPLPFFSMRSLAAGWYLWWRLGLAAFVTFFVVLILLLPVAEYPRSPVLVQRYWWGGILAVVLIVLHRLVDRTTRKWAPKPYGRTFEGSGEQQRSHSSTRAP
jgi:hypothetical protein